MSNRYKERKPVSVSIEGTSAKYGWLTNLSDADSGALGHTAVDETGDSESGVVFFGASNPKPPRARKADDGTTSFYEDAGALPAGWVSIGRGKSFARAALTAKSKMVYVLIQDAKYAWRMPLETYNKIGGDKTALGIKDLTNNDKAFLGVNTITGTTIGRLGKPPRAHKEVTGNDGVDLISTYSQFPIVATPPAGWTIS